MLEPKSNSRPHAGLTNDQPFRTLNTIGIGRFASLAVAVLLLGCAPSADSPSESKAEPKSESLLGKDADTPGAHFTVQIKSGDHAGTYQLDSYDPQPCQIGMTGVNMFSVNASGKAPSLVYGETFIHEFQAGGGNTELFNFGAKTADFDVRVNRLPGPFEPAGHGTATYTDDGANRIEVKITGESKDGIAFEATVTCSRVGR